MPFRTLLVIFLLVGPLVGASSPRWVGRGALVAAFTPTPAACDAPAEFTKADATFASVATALRAGQTLDVLAVGSGTMLGPNRTAEGSFPYRMAAQLQEAVPGAQVKLTVRSGRGLTATDMLTSIRSELAAHPYQLVLWQTGTVEAVRDLPADEFLQTLSDGVRAVRDASGDIVLIDPQYSRFLHSNANLDPYLLAMRQAGAMDNATLFRRYDLMKYLVDNSRVDLERADRSQRQAVADLLHECLGRSLAVLILNAAGLRTQ